MKEAEFLLSKPNTAIKINNKGYTSYKCNLHDFVKLNLELINQTNDYFRKERLKQEIENFARLYNKASKAPVNTKIK